MVAGLKPVHLVAAAMVAGAVLYVAGRKPGETGAGIASAGVDLVAGVFVGGVEAIGNQVGIPETNEDECDRAIAEGRTLDASFACPAGRWIKSLFE